MSGEFRSLVDQLFNIWGSDDLDLIEPFFHPDAYLWDSVNGGYSGWPEISGLYIESLKRWTDMRCVATRFWPADDTSISFTWTATAKVGDDRFGTQLRGAECQFDGMSYIEFEDGLILREIEYFDRAAPARSIGLEVEQVFFR